MCTLTYQYISAAGNISGLPSKTRFINSIPGQLVSSPSRPSSSTLPSVSATKYTRTGGFYSERKKVRTGPSTGDPIPRSSIPGSGESLLQAV